MKNKVHASFEEAVADIPDGATIMMHSFLGPGGIAQNLILALRDKGAKNLTVVSCNFNRGGLVAGHSMPEVITANILVENKQVKKAITSFVATSRAAGIASALEEAAAAGEVEVEVVPQGTLAERIRAGGAGIGGFYCPVGVGTLIAEGKEKRVIKGKEYILELPLTADFGFVKAYKADRLGNLAYRGASRSFNPLIATAARITIAEVDEIVEIGELDPEYILTPGVFVDRMVKIPEGGKK
ncbi:MAG: CoA transferase subunit A [Deltaproteobacteria bacterium]|nr:MAG: CoA transferase subunit A [Deltaproteobacteria bacterium]